VTSNVFNILPVEKTKDKGSSIYDSKNSIGRTFIHSTHLEPEIQLNVGIKAVDTHAKIEVKVLLDSSATGLFINCVLVQNNSIAMCILDHPIPVYNIDRSLNRGGSITEEVTLIMSYQGHQEKTVFEVCDLGKASLIMGYTWLCKHHPDIDWETEKVHMTCCPKECNVYLKWMKRRQRLTREKENGKKHSVTMEEVPDEEMPNVERLIMINELDEDSQEDLVHKICGGQSWDPNPKVVNKPVEELVPEWFHNFLLVFQKRESECMLLRKLWDHMIKMKLGFVLKKSKVYLLSPLEQEEEVDSFITEQLRKGYIWPSKLPQTSPIFFWPKKDLKKWMCTDYCYLHKQMIKNAYPLPLISETIDKVGKAKVFTKLDLCWGYNNVWIKEGDEWKVAFATCHGSF
jgi:hypothetical protein